MGECCGSCLTALFALWALALLALLPLLALLALLALHHNRDVYRSDEDHSSDIICSSDGDYSSATRHLCLLWPSHGCESMSTFVFVVELSSNTTSSSSSSSSSSSDGGGSSNSSSSSRSSNRVEVLGKIL